VLKFKQNFIKILTIF